MLMANCVFVYLGVVWATQRRAEEKNGERMIMAVMVRAKMKCDGDDDSCCSISGYGGKE